MTNYDVRLSRFASDNKLTRKETDKVVDGYIYDVGEIGIDGSEKQISWAKDIQVSAIEALGQLVKNIKKADNYNDDSVKVLDAIVSNVFSHTDAKWWLDNRNDLSAYDSIIKFAK